MSTGASARTTRDTLNERFKSDAEILKSGGELLAFSARIASGEPLGYLEGLALIVGTGASAIAAANEVISRLLRQDKTKRSQVPPYDRFRVLFYVTCLRSYIESLPGLEKRLQKLKTGRQNEEKLHRLRKQIEGQIAALDEAQVTFLFNVQPLQQDVPLFNALDDLIGSTLALYGYDGPEVAKAVKECNKEARQRFAVFVSSDTQDALWIRNYLAIATEPTKGQALSDLSSVRLVLANWSAPVGNKRKKTAWQAYKETLRELPDQRGTMFNEQFGVRKVFVKPQATYHVTGAPGDAGKPSLAQDIGSLLAALTSSRASGDDLVILCGGPGSGKSTLCRILASEFARDENMHPVFLPLRRMKEGAEVTAYLEQHMQRNGLISRPSELRSIPNLVVILDGFDELVMASRSRLRHFFNILREEHHSGLLKSARIVVSGRDTLFPKGEGLPSGSHVISLVPFDKPRVDVWGKKWRSTHSDGPGSTFDPVTLISEETSKRSKPPLHHLVTWPLTLHLVARVHTAGLLDVTGKSQNLVEKAYLYRSILAETSMRQTEQAEGKGRLNPQEMRKFLRSLAWKMYSDSTDSLDVTEVTPLLASFFPGANDTDLTELADVAVVNSPELSKGEETGFEFVHKSFSEYLVAEHIAFSIEKVIFKAKDFGVEEPTWRMTPNEALCELSPILALRLIPEEVQEMLEPMLGCLEPFLSGTRADQVVAARSRASGLERVISRFESLFQHCIQSNASTIIYDSVRQRMSVRHPLEAYANFAAGMLIIGSAASRHIRQIAKDSDRHFVLSDGEASFWRSVFLLCAGGLSIDSKLASRLFAGTSISSDASVSDISSPFRIGNLAQIRGFSPQIGHAISETVRRHRSSLLRNTISSILLAYLVEPEDFDKNVYHFLEDWRRMRPDRANDLEPIVETLLRSGHVQHDWYAGNGYEDWWFREFRWMDSTSDIVQLIERYAEDVFPRAGYRRAEDALFLRALRSATERSDTFLPRLREVLRGFPDL